MGSSPVTHWLGSFSAVFAAPGLLAPMVSPPDELSLWSMLVGWSVLLGSSVLVC